MRERERERKQSEFHLTYLSLSHARIKEAQGSTNALVASKVFPSASSAWNGFPILSMTQL